MTKKSTKQRKSHKNKQKKKRKRKKLPGDSDGKESVCNARESHGQKSLAGYNKWGCKESDMTERLLLSFRCNSLSILSWKSILYVLGEPYMQINTCLNKREAKGDLTHTHTHACMHVQNRGVSSVTMVAEPRVM